MSAFRIGVGSLLSTPRAPSRSNNMDTHDTNTGPHLLGFRPPTPQLLGTPSSSPTPSRGNSPHLHTDTSPRRLSHPMDLWEEDDVRVTLQSSDDLFGSPLSAIQSSVPSPAAPPPIRRWPFGLLHSAMRRLYVNPEDSDEDEETDQSAGSAAQSGSLSERL